MKTRCLSSFFGLAILGAFLSLSSLALADVDDPLLNDARANLEKAWNPGGDPPSDDDRVALLKSALADLKKVPPGGYHGHRMKAIDFIQSALFELDKGDPDHKAGDYIHSAVEEIRNIT